MSITSGYTLEKELSDAGWIKGFDISAGGHSYIAISDAPPIGSCPGGKLFIGHWTKPDGTSLYSRMNMDRTNTITVYNPMGYVTHQARLDSWIETNDYILSLGIV